MPTSFPFQTVDRNPVEPRAPGGIPTRITRVKLLYPWYSLGWSYGLELTAQNQGSFGDNVVSADQQPILLRDLSGMILGEYTAQYDPDHDPNPAWYLPAGSVCTVWQAPTDLDGHYELLHASALVEEDMRWQYVPTLLAPPPPDAVPTLEWTQLTVLEGALPGVPVTRWFLIAHA